MRHRQLSVKAEEEEGEGRKQVGGRLGGNKRKDEEKETQILGREGNVGEKEASLKINGKEGKEIRKRKLIKEGSSSKTKHGKQTQRQLPGGEVTQRHAGVNLLKKPSITVVIEPLLLMIKQDNKFIKTCSQRLRS